MYYMIHDWMINDLELKGAQLLCYALIYSFSREGQGTYFGSNKDMRDVTGFQERAVRDALRDLEAAGLIIRSEGFHQGTRCFDYTVPAEGANNAGGKKCRGQKMPGEGANFAGQMGQILPSLPPTPPIPKDNIYNNTRDNQSARTRAREELRLPYSSQEFVTTWEQLCQQPKWRRKRGEVLQAALDKLAGFPEVEAVAMMRNAIVGDWQGLFPLRPEERRALRASAAQPVWQDLDAIAEGSETAREGRAI